MKTKISINAIKALRDKTNAGMMDCKQALEATKGNIEEAIDWLRKKGISKAAKKANRETSEGITQAFVVGNKAVLFCLSCETDFVARNKEFMKLIDTVKSYLATVTSEDVLKALQISLNGFTLQNILDNAIATLGENIVLRKIIILTKKDSECFVVYNHANNKISSACLYDKEILHTEGKKIAMQIAAMNPSYIAPGDVAAEVIEKEKEIIRSQMNEDEKLRNKSEKVLNMILNGRLAKNMAEICLISQELIMDTQYTVGKWLDMQKVKVLKMARIAIGE